MFMWYTHGWKQPAVAPSPWRFKMDVSLRRRLFGDAAFAHPAKLHLGLLQRLIDLYTCSGETILDPMAGSGSLMIAATLGRNVVLRELEPEYVAMMEQAPIRGKLGMFAGQIDIAQGDARTLTGVRCNHIIFSPPYGIEVSGNHMSTERRLEMLSGKYGERWTRKLSKSSSSHGTWVTGFSYVGHGISDNAGNKSGRNYWADMRRVYARCADLLPAPGGRLILILKNHYRRGKLCDVVGQAICEVEALGLPLMARHEREVWPLSLWQRRRREKGQPVVEVEDVLVFGKAKVRSKPDACHCDALAALAEGERV